MSCMDPRPIFVKVGREGGVIKEYCVASNATISDLFVKAGIGMLNAELDQIIHNGQITSLGILSSFVRTGDIIIIKRRPVATTIRVKVSKVGSSIRTVTMASGSNVNSCITEAGLYLASDEEIWLHKDDKSAGTKTGLYETVQDGWYLIIEKKKDPKREMIASILGDFYEENMCSECGGLDIRELGPWVEKILEVK